MYDKYPEYDVPEKNILQKFLAQRWSAIIIELAMTLVIMVAAGRALDPFNTQTETTSQVVVMQPVVIQQPAPASSGISVDVIKDYGIDYIRNQQYPEAEGMYDLAVVADPSDMSNFAWRGYANINSGDYVEAQADYNTVVASDPTSFDGHNSLCWAYGELGVFDKALDHCNEALALASAPVDYVIAYENSCWVKIEMRDYSNAYRDCMKVFEIQPDCQYESCALAHYNLGRILMVQGEQSSAVEHFNRAYLYGSQYEVMYLDIAKAYQELGYEAAAIASYEKYVQLAGENADPVAQSQISILGG